MTEKKELSSINLTREELDAMLEVVSNPRKLCKQATIDHYKIMYNIDIEMCSTCTTLHLKGITCPECYGD